jgi:hypothetical protein
MKALSGSRREVSIVSKRIAKVFQKIADLIFFYPKGIFMQSRRAMTINIQHDSQIDPAFVDQNVACL